MCRSKAHGGSRCKRNATVVNARRRERHTVKVSRQLVDDVINEQGAEWVGDVDDIGLKLNSPLIVKAYSLAVKAHAPVRRKSLEPYINHPLRVAQKLQSAGFNDEVIAVALLHDAVEDSDMTFGTLRKHGFNERIVSGVDSVTKRPGEPYEDAIKRAIAHPIGRLVKLSDNRDNSSDEQLAPFSPQKQEVQRAKYMPTQALLIKSIRDDSPESLFTEHNGFHSSYQIKLSPDIISDIFG